MMAAIQFCIDRGQWDAMASKMQQFAVLMQDLENRCRSLTMDEQAEEADLWLQLSLQHRRMVRSLNQRMMRVKEDIVSVEHGLQQLGKSSAGLHG